MSLRLEEQNNIDLPDHIYSNDTNGGGGHLKYFD